MGVYPAHSGRRGAQEPGVALQSQHHLHVPARALRGDDEKDPLALWLASWSAAGA